MIQSRKDRFDQFFELYNQECPASFTRNQKLVLSLVYAPVQISDLLSKLEFSDFKTINWIIFSKHNLEVIKRVLAHYSINQDLADTRTFSTDDNYFENDYLIGNIKLKITVPKLSKLVAGYRFENQDLLIIDDLWALQQSPIIGTSFEAFVSSHQNLIALNNVFTPVLISHAENFFDNLGIRFGYSLLTKVITERIDRRFGLIKIVKGNVFSKAELNKLSEDKQIIFLGGNDEEDSSQIYSTVVLPVLENFTNELAKPLLFIDLKNGEDNPFLIFNTEKLGLSAQGNAITYLKTLMSYAVKLRYPISSGLTLEHCWFTFNCSNELIDELFSPYSSKLNRARGQQAEKELDYYIELDNLFEQKFSPQKKKQLENYLNSTKPGIIHSNHHFDFRNRIELDNKLSERLTSLFIKEIERLAYFFDNQEEQKLFLLQRIQKISNSVMFGLEKKYLSKDNGVDSTKLIRKPAQLEETLNLYLDDNNKELFEHSDKIYRNAILNLRRSNAKAARLIDNLIEKQNQKDKGKLFLAGIKNHEYYKTNSNHDLIIYEETNRFLERTVNEMNRALKQEIEQARLIKKNARLLDRLPDATNWIIDNSKNIPVLMIHILDVYRRSLRTNHHYHKLINACFIGDSKFTLANEEISVQRKYAIDKAFVEYAAELINDCLLTDDKTIFAFHNELNQPNTSKLLFIEKPEFNSYPDELFYLYAITEAQLFKMHKLPYSVEALDNKKYLLKIIGNTHVSWESLENYLLQVAFQIIDNGNTKIISISTLVEKTLIWLHPFLSETINGLLGRSVTNYAEEFEPQLSQHELQTKIKTLSQRDKIYFEMLKAGMANKFLITLDEIIELLLSNHAIEANPSTLRSLLSLDPNIIACDRSTYVLNYWEQAGKTIGGNLGQLSAKLLAKAKTAMPDELIKEICKYREFDFEQDYKYIFKQLKSKSYIDRHYHFNGNYFTAIS